MRAGVAVALLLMIGCAATPVSPEVAVAIALTEMGPIQRASQVVRKVLPPKPAVSRPVLYLFHADWCGPCRLELPLSALLYRRGLPVFTVDFDRRKDLVDQCGVTQVPRWVVVQDGRVLGSHPGVVKPPLDRVAIYDDNPEAFIVQWFERVSSGNGSRPASVAGQTPTQ